MLSEVPGYFLSTFSCDTKSSILVSLYYGATLFPNPLQRAANTITMSQENIMNYL